MHNISLLLWILTLLSLVGLFVGLWLLIITALSAASACVIKARGAKTLWTVTYTFDEDTFSVIKTDLAGKETVLEKLPVTEITCEFCDVLPENKHYFSDFDDFGMEKPLRIIAKEADFTVLSDKYMYSLLQKGKKGKV